MRLSIQVQNISKFTFKLLDCFKHFQISNYLLVTLYLPQSETDGKDSKSDKMSSAHPNLNPLYVLDSISQEELMGKKPF